MNLTKTLLVALTTALLAGCGGIDSVDSTLATGRVQGKLTNAKPGAYVYVFGHPEIRGAVQGDGSYQLDKVPVGDGKAQVVLFDGGDLGEGKAELHEAEVQPAEHTTLDRDANDMPLAGSLVAVARCKGGQRGDKTTYAVEGTEFDGKKGGGDTFRMYPLPPGATFTVKGSLKGFKEGLVQGISVDAGAETSVSIELDVDDHDAAKGCLSAQCASGLSCDDDGSCYECSKRNGVVTGCESKPGYTCEEHVCVPGEGSGNGRSACLPCSSPSQCASGPTPAGVTPLCIAVAGASVCSHSCAADTDCPSGYSCAAGACAPLSTCSTLLQAFGQVCTDDAQCSTALADAHCQGLVKDKNHVVVQAGYCTSRCDSVGDCPTGFSCDSSLRVCTH